MKSIFTLCLLSFILFTCQKEDGKQASGSTTASIPLSGQYVYEDVPNSDAQVGFLRDAAGKTLETGGVIVDFSQLYHVH